MIGRMYVQRGSGSYFCTASVINSPHHNIVLTAGHCMGSRIFPVDTDSRGRSQVWIDQRYYDRGHTKDAPWDVAFVRLGARGDGKQVQDVVGANTLVTEHGYAFPRVRLIGYSNTDRQPRGFSGGYSTLSRYVRTLRDGTAVPAPAPIPSPRTISGWIMRPREKLSPGQAAELERVRLACPDVTEACNLARAFTDLARNRRGHLLTEWIRQGERCGQPSIRSFAGFLRQDLDAVTAGLTLAYSSGVVEGHVCRVKLLKRSVYGRASFALLRARIMARP
ncbi:transposase [Streptomyces sp. NPDC002671]